jgi:hypothetical protein
MRQSRRIGAWAGGWLVAVTAAHLGTNVDWSALTNERQPLDRRKFNVAYIPVT